MDFDSLKQVKNEFRPVPFWSWNLTLGAERLDREAEEFVRGGAGGFFCHGRSGLFTEYLGREFMDAILTSARAARRSGLDMWLYDEDKWPSGYGGGEVTAVYDYRMRAMLLVGESEIEEGDKVISRRGGNAIVVRVAPIGQSRYNGYCYTDMFNPDTVRAFFDCTHEKYARIAKKFIGHEIKGIFTDEPAYSDYCFSGRPSLPYSEHLARYFMRRFGYSLWDAADKLFYNDEGCQKARLDYYTAASDLFAENFTKQYHEWCKAHGLKFVGHFMCEDNLVIQTEWIGNAALHYENMDYPGIDILGGALDSTVTVKQLTSVTEQLSKERSLCEVFACTGQHYGISERRGMINYLTALGINFINPHLAPSSLQGERKRDYPPTLFYQQPYYVLEHNLSEYTARLCEMVAKSKNCVDVLVISPLESVWSEMSPIDKSAAYEYSGYFDAICQGLTHRQIDYHIAPPSVLRRHGDFSNGKIRIGEYEYKAVVLPPCKNISADVLGILASFCGKAYAAAPFPETVDCEAPKVYSLPKSVEKFDGVKSLIDCLDRDFSSRAKAVDENGEILESVGVSHRSDGGDDFYFFYNTDIKNGVDAVISIPDTRRAYVFDQSDGEIYGFPFERSAKIRLEKSGSLTVLFTDKAVRSERLPASTKCGAVFKQFAPIGKITPDRASHSENILRLDKVNFFAAGSEPMLHAFSDFCGDKFRALADGTPFRAEYTFDVEAMPEGRVYAVIEAAKNLDSIKINGSSVTPTGEYFIDPSFDKIDIFRYLKKGHNLLEISGKKHGIYLSQNQSVSQRGPQKNFATELETAYIAGDFLIDGQTIKKSLPVAAGDVTAQGMPSYVGALTYRVTLPDMELSGKRLRLDGEFSAAKVTIGRKTYELTASPYEIELSERERGASVEITLYNTLHNLLGTVRIKGSLDYGKWHCPETFTDKSNYSDELLTIPFGLDRVLIGE